MNYNLLMKVKQLLKLKTTINVESETCCPQNTFHDVRVIDFSYYRYQELAEIQIFIIISKKISEKLLINIVFNYLENHLYLYGF